MTESEKNEIHAHVQAIAAILYKDTESREPEKLTSLEGIEISSFKFKKQQSIQT
jgi:hypothetical protein